MSPQMVLKHGSITEVSHRAIRVPQVSSIQLIPSLRR